MSVFRSQTTEIRVSATRTTSRCSRRDKAVNRVEQQLRDLIAPGTGCGPISAVVRVARHNGFLEVHAEVEHPIKHLPVPEAPHKYQGVAVNVGLRVAGPKANFFNVAFYASSTCRDRT